MKQLITVLALISMAGSFAGCTPDECRRMTDCCAQVDDVEGMGQACGKLAQNVTKPETCRSVVQTVSYMYEDRGLELPEVCKVTPDDR